MDNKEVKIKCYKCGNSFTSSMMRYDPMNPSRLICRNCLGKKDERKATVYDSKPKEGEPTVKYYCIKCHYKFERRKSVHITACPYCGSETLTTKTDADSLIGSAGKEGPDK